MKKLAIFFAIVILIVSAISYMYFNYKANYYESQKANKKFENYLNEEIEGRDLASVINRAIDNNIQNEVSKNNKGIYEDNNQNSIKIEIKITDNDEIYQMETLYNRGMDKFVIYFGDIKFKCVDIKYHVSTNKVKYMLFEQISS